MPQTITFGASEIERTPPPPQDGAAMSAAESGTALPATSAPDDPFRPVTLGDLQADPVAALQRIGAILKRDVTDPKTWAMAAATYFGPKALNAAWPVVAKAIRSAPASTPSAPKPPSALKEAIKAAAPEIGKATIGYRATKGLEAMKGARDAFKAAKAAGASAPSTAPVESAVPSTSAPVPPPSAGPAPSPMAKPQLTLEEFQVGLKLAKEGYPEGDILKAIERLRASSALASKLGTPSDASVQQKVIDRNATGRWRED